MANKKFTNPINRGRIVANKFEVTDVTGNEKIIKDINSNVNVQGTKLDANFFTELQKGLVFTVDSVHSVESGVDIYTLAIDGLYGNNNPLGFPLFNGLSLNIKIDISNTETASKIRISDSDYTFLKENDNTYSTLNAGELIKNNYYKVIYNGSEFILSNTTKATETNSGILKIATTSQVTTGTDNTTAVSPSKLKELFVNGVNVSANGYEKLPNGLIRQWGYISFSSVPTGIGNLTETTVYFPIRFPNACRGVYLTGNDVVGDDGLECVHSARTITVLGFVHRATRFYGASGSLPGSANWEAIGY